MLGSPLATRAGSQKRVARNCAHRGDREASEWCRRQARVGLGATKAVPHVGDRESTLVSLAILRSAEFVNVLLELSALLLLAYHLPIFSAVEAAARPSFDQVRLRDGATKPRA